MAEAILQRLADAVVQRGNGVVGLKPPEPLQDLNAEQFKKWKRDFEIYRVASGSDKSPEEVQVALLLHCMGQECRDIHETFTFDTAGDDKKYTVVMDKFTNHFIPLKNESVNSHLFFTRNQLEGESFDTFLTDIKRLSQDCDFGDLKDRLIRDRIVTGIENKKVKDRLLRETNLTLTKTIQICKEAELASEQVKKMDGQVDVQAIKKNYEKKNYYEHDRERKVNNSGQRQNFAINNTSRQQTINSTWRNQGSSQSGENRDRNSSWRNQNATDERRPVSRYPEQGECQRCGYQHPRGRCPAYMKTCEECGKIGHFKKKCRSKEVREVQVEYDSASSSDLQLFIINIDNVNSENCWYENVEFVEQGGKVKFKLDTGAQCNVISKNVCEKLKIRSIQKSNLKLANYNGERIITIGEINVECRVADKIQRINFQVCQGNFVPILGLPTLNALKLIKRNIQQEVNSVNYVDKNEMFKNFGDLFEGVGQIEGFEYKIKLNEDASGKIEPCRHVPFKLMPKLKGELERMLKLGVISRVEEPTEFVSSLVMTTKPDRSLRVCLDPQYLNTQVQREPMLIPTLEEITSKLNGDKIFSTLDADKESRHLTTFNTPYGRYWFNRLPFGLSTSPEIFHRVFTKIFDDIEGVEIYIDDVLIHAKNEREHDEILNKVLVRARKFGVKFNKNKCQIKVNEVKYLGHIISDKGLRVDPERTKAIVEMEEPKNREELLRFLGMINYVSKFIPNISEVTAPLRMLIKKNVPYIWSESQRNAYELLKKMLCESPVLAYFDIEKKIVLSVDASKNGLGCVILQDAKPVAYGSRSLTETEKNYSQIEKESLAILYGCTKFHQYLYGQNFIVETDHKPLVSIFSKPLNKCPARLQKIRLAIQPYSVELKYKPGRELLIADHLSRSYLNDSFKTYELDVEAHVAMIDESFNITDNKLHEIREETSKDVELRTVKEYIKNGWPNNKCDVSSNAKAYFIYRDELSESKGIIFKSEQMIIPQSLRKEMLQKIHYAHLGIDKCKSLARKCLFWPGMSKQIEDLIQNCDTCKRYQNNNAKEPMICKEIPSGPWEIVSADIFFLNGNPYILIVDAFSKYVEIKRLNNLTTGCTINEMKEIFARHGVPEAVYTDSGSQFTSREFKIFSQEWNFIHKIVSPKHHIGNGLAERYIQTVKRMLKKMIEERKDINLGLLIYRNTPVSNDGKTPAELLYNRKVKNVIPNCRVYVEQKDDFRNELVRRQEIQKNYFDKHSKQLPVLEKGEVVKIQNENNQKPHKSGIVIDRDENPRAYQIKEEHGQILKRNRRMLIKGGNFSEIDDYLEAEIEDDVENQNNVENDFPNLTNQGNNSRINNQEIPRVSSQVQRNNYYTRSGREVKKPGYLKDYV